MRQSTLVVVCVFALGAAGSCAPSRGTNPGGDPDAGDGVGGGTGGPLLLVPADDVLVSDGKTALTLAYQVMQDGKDVTAQAKLSVDDGRVGMVSGATFTQAPGGAGKTTVRATLGMATGSTSLTIRVGTVVIAAGAPMDAASKFGGAPSAQSQPSIAYPSDGALVPPNLNQLEFQFDPAGYDLFEIGFSGDAVDLKVYTTCKTVGTGCGYTPDATTWKFLSSAGRGLTLDVKVRGTLLAGGAVGSSASNKLSFGSDDVEGGLYYWAASAGGIFRYEFGRTGQTAEPFYTSTQAGAICAGCHALSRNGKKIAVGLNTPGPAQMRALDVATRKPLFADVGSGTPFGGGSNYQAFTPDGSKLVTTEGNGLTLRDTATGKVIGPSPIVPNANMPDFSTDGTKVVFARDSMGCPLGGLCPNLSTKAANLYVIGFSGNGFGTARPLVMGGGNNYYPAFSPDSQFVLFNRAPGDSYDNMAASVMVAAVAGGGARDMPNVNSALGNSWPKWAPFVQHFGASTIFWITFSTRRQYGLHTGTNSQIWMAAFQPDKLAGGGDPSYPAFWLPFQDPATGNHIAQWVEKVERAPCSQVDQAGCMSNEVCENGVCVPKIM